MKTVTVGLLSHLASDVTTLALCWKITPSTGAALGFTSHTADLVISGMTYRSAQGFNPTTIQTTGGLSVDNLDVKGLLDALGITETSVMSGVYDGAPLEVFLVNWADLTQGIVKLRKGFLGNARLTRLGFEAEVRGLLERFQRQITEVYTPGCRADLGDTRCGVRMTAAPWTATTAYTARTSGDAKTGSLVAPTTPNGYWYHCSVAGTSGGSEPAWNTTLGGTTTEGTVTWVTISAMVATGTVTAVTNKRTFVDTARTEATDVFLGGLLTWTSGNNAGLSMEVKSWTNGTQTFVLMLPMRATIQVGDAYSVYPGCAKDVTTCKTKFNNVYNYRGEPFVPQEQSMAITAIR